MNISCRIANADTQCGRITNPPERGIPFFKPDGMGPNLECGGNPYPYKTRICTFFFKPIE